MLVSDFRYHIRVSPTLSIIIPTHRRAAILERCLGHLEQQTIRNQLEVIVVSDGPDDDARAACEKPRSIPVRFFQIPKSHQGVARNKGVQEASAELCLFMGDDCLLESTACEVHLRVREKFQAPRSKDQKIINSQLSIHNLVLGFTTWDPSIGITDVMRWLEQTGWQFGYPMIEQYAHGIIPKDIQHRFTYTSHISLPTAVARAHPFRENVSLYGWEDIEWGTRLRDAGIPLVYEPDARALHHHRLTLQDSLKRMRTLGASAVHLSRIAPQLDRLPRGWKLTAYRLVSLLPTMRGKHARAFLQGIDSIR